jgi:hypothetical protein
MAKQKTELLQGTVEILVLRLLQSGPLNGWDMMQRVALVSGEVLAVTPGSLYPASTASRSAAWSPARGARPRTSGGRSSTD